jgi:hypothetical protein
MSNFMYILLIPHEFNIDVFLFFQTRKKTLRICGCLQTVRALLGKHNNDFEEGMNMIMFIICGYIVERFHYLRLGNRQYAQ